MLGFAWLTLRQAQDALRAGRLEEAHRLLCQPAAQGHKKAGDLFVRVAHAFVERGRCNLQHEDPTAAWNDLMAAEQVGVKDEQAVQLRHDLARRGIGDVRSLLEAGEPGKAVEVVSQLRARSVQHPDLEWLDEAAKGWNLAKEQSGRGEFAQALQTVDRVRRLLPGPVEALGQFAKVLEYRHQSFAALLVALHEAVERHEWREVIRLSEEVLAVAPQHLEARKARARAWRTLEPETIAAVPQAREPGRPETPRTEPRYLLWIDGVGGFLVCLGARLTIGQATPEAAVDIPLFADVSRVHATLTRDAEGYLLEAARPLLVNGKPAEKALLQTGDRVTLGSACQLQFRQPVAVSASARLDLASGHRLPLAVDGVLLMADTLVLGPGPQVHVSMPEMQKPVVLYRHKEGLGVRYGGNLVVDGQKCKERGNLKQASTVAGDDFAFAIEPVGTGMGR